MGNTVAFKRYDFGYASSVSVVWMLLVGLAAGTILLVTKNGVKRRRYSR